MIISFLWGLLYLPHLRTSPRWYGDETLTLMIGKSLASGQAADRSLNATFWHPSYPYQPGFAWLAGVMAWIFGGDILGARLLSCSIALLVALLIYFGGRAILGCLPSFFGSSLVSIVRSGCDSLSMDLSSQWCRSRFHNYDSGFASIKSTTGGLDSRFRTCRRRTKPPTLHSWCCRGLGLPH